MMQADDSQSFHRDQSTSVPDSNNKSTPVPDSDNIASKDSSGHGLCSKFQLSLGCFGSLFAFGAIAPMRDIYVLKFGADLTSMGIVGFVVAFWSALCDPVSGYMQDTVIEWYDWLLPVPTWGKRAPWVTTHLLVLSIALVASYFPLDGVYEFWYLWVMMLGAWCYSTINTAFAASIFSLYKFKKQRAITEGFGYISKTFGLLTGFTFFVITLANASSTVRGLQALVGVAFLLLCQVSIPVYKTVQQEAGTAVMTTAEVCTTLKELFTQNRAFYVLSLVAAFDGARASMTTFIPFYLTYVAKVSVDARSVYIGGIILGVLLVKVILVVGLQCLLSRRPGIDLQQFNAVCELACAVASLACFLYSRSAAMMVIYVLIREVFKTPHLFWFFLAQTWVIDEDVAAVNKSREGLFIGILNMVFQLSAALFGAVTYIGLGVAGLNVADCSKFDDGSDEYNECYKGDQNSQPDAIEDYIVYLFVVAYTVLCVLMALAIWTFPIKGSRLRELERAKQRRLQGASASVTTCISVPAAATAPVGAFNVDSSSATRRGDSQATQAGK